MKIYAGGFVYENSVLSFFSSPEGRVVKNGSTFEYQYGIADHQGNTRVVFSSVTPPVDAPVATFEGDANDGAAQYINGGGTNLVSFGGANHTTGGSKVMRMNQSNKIGPARSVKVYPGDKIDIEVWEYHEGGSGYGTTGSTLTNLITSVTGAFTGSVLPTEVGMMTTGVNNALTIFGTGGNQGDVRPAAYLNYILFDKNYNVLDAGWQLAPATTFTKQKVSFPTKNIKEEGYVYTWLSYDDASNNYVYFDDFKVTHTKTNVIQSNEYYPFGLQTSSSWTRTNNKNNFLYNEGSELNAISGLYDLPYRNYDAALGRFFQVDPLAVRDHSVSSYAYAGNSPGMYNDPLGLQLNVTGYSDSQLRSMYRQDLAFGGFGGSFGDWAQANLDFGGTDRAVVGTDGKAYGVSMNGQMGTYSLNEYGFYSYASSDGGKTVTNTGWTTDHYELEFKPVGTQTQGGVVLDVNGNVKSWPAGANNIYVDVDGKNAPFHERLVKNGTMTSEGFSNGLVNILNGMKLPKGKFDKNLLLNGKISLALSGVKPYNGGTYEDAVAHTPPGVIPIRITYEHINGNLTVNSVQSILGIHEYYIHGIEGLIHAITGDDGTYYPMNEVEIQRIIRENPCPCN